MEHPFDTLSRSLGEQRSRRGLLKQFVGAMAGAVAASVLPRAVRGAPVCDPGLVLCAGGCTDLMSDPGNCGACGAAAAPGGGCSNGMITAPPGGPPAGPPTGGSTLPTGGGGLPSGRGTPGSPVPP